MNRVVYISKCSGCRNLESVSVSPTPKGCVLVSTRDENGDCVGQDSAYAFNSIVSDIILEFLLNMIIYCMQSPNLVKAILSNTIWSLNMYFEDFEIDSERGRIFGMRNPKYSLEDFMFNESTDYETIKNKFNFSRDEVKIVAVNWNPNIE